MKKLRSELTDIPRLARQVKSCIDSSILNLSDNSDRLSGQSYSGAPRAADSGGVGAIRDMMFLKYFAVDVEGYMNRIESPFGGEGGLRSLDGFSR